MATLSPREYQKAIFNTAKEKNTLVVIPTGVGKTLIAIMLAHHKIKELPSKKVLVLAPTKPLVEQHLVSFKSQTPDLFADVQLFTGAIPADKRKKIWETSDIVISTPQCIANDLKKYLYDLKEVSLLIIDEAHRCLKNYDYNFIAQKYKQQSENRLVLGLTASPGSEKDKVQQICKNLDIENVEIRTRESEDVKPYLQEREYHKIEVPFPDEFNEIRILLKRIYDSKIEQLKSRNLLFAPPTKIALLQLQKKLGAQSHLGNFNILIGLSLCAQAIKISHAIELLETQTLSGLKEYLDNLIKQAMQKKSKGVQTLVNSAEFQSAITKLRKLIENKIEHPKLEELKAHIESEFLSNQNSKIIVFSQFRETAQAISKILNSLSPIKAKMFVGQAKKSSSGETTGLNQREQREIIEQFKNGEVNVLCATSIGEEGLDIPEVNAVYFYEPIPSAIRKIQRAGRTARLKPGKLAILITKSTRDEAHHYASIAREKRMYSVLSSVKEDLKNSNKIKTLEDFKQK